MILNNKYPVFEYLPVETIIRQKQTEYYNSLSISDKEGKSTIFIEFMLEVIEVALENLLKSQNISVNQQDRLNLARDLFLADSFSRQEYLRYFKTISTATASRDLKYGVEKGYLEKSGDKRMTKYKFKRIPNRKLTQD